MKFILILVLVLSASALSGATEERVYPISKAAIDFIRYAYPEEGIQAAEVLRKSPDAFVDFTPSSHIFFKRYGIRFGYEDSSFAYDGRAVIIRETKENHEKISLILRVIEDMVRSSENQKKFTIKPLE
jgi:hypothetical protein